MWQIEVIVNSCTATTTREHAQTLHVLLRVLKAPAASQPNHQSKKKNRCLGHFAHAGLYAMVVVMGWCPKRGIFLQVRCCLHHRERERAHPTQFHACQHQAARQR